MDLIYLVNFLFSVDSVVFDLNLFVLLAWFDVIFMLFVIWFLYWLFWICDLVCVVIVLHVWLLCDFLWMFVVFMVAFGFIWYVLGIAYFCLLLFGWWWLRLISWMILRLGALVRHRFVLVCDCVWTWFCVCRFVLFSFIWFDFFCLDVGVMFVFLFLFASVAIEGLLFGIRFDGCVVFLNVMFLDFFDAVYLVN